MTSARLVQQQGLYDDKECQENIGIKLYQFMLSVKEIWANQRPKLSKIAMSRLS